MAISYNKLLCLLEERNENSYTLTKKNHVIGQASLTKIQCGGHIDTRTINALCDYLDCQPGDIMEFIRE